MADRLNSVKNNSNFNRELVKKMYSTNLSLLEKNQLAAGFRKLAAGF